MHKESTTKRNSRFHCSFFKQNMPKDPGGRLSEQRVTNTEFQVCLFTVRTLSLRMRFEKVGTGYLMLPVPRTVYYSHVYTMLVNVRFWSGHYGDWAIPQFRTRLVGSVSSMDALRDIFGPQFVQPKQQASLSGYNTNQEKGPASGYLLLFNLAKAITCSVCRLVSLSSNYV
jgi:hypothetical protein